MAMNLDARQLAILQEMGITVWCPPPAVALPASVTPAEPQAATAVAAVTQPTPRPATPATPWTSASTPERTPPVPAASASATAALPHTAPAPAPTTDLWHIAPAVQAYPHASASAAHADDGWLVIWESPNPGAPLEGDVGKLLDNMLRALRLHHHPNVWLACMQRPGHEALPTLGMPQAPVDWQTLDSGLAADVQRLHPARILLLGMHCARAVLGSQAALGQLRAAVHQVHAVPTVVSYDPAYLLRAPHAKPATWADLCRAHGLRKPPVL